MKGIFEVFEGINAKNIVYFPKIVTFAVLILDSYVSNCKNRRSAV